MTSAAIRMHWGRWCAFSLIEVLVAMGVCAILAILLAGLTDSTVRLWRDSGNRAEVLLEARAALDVMRRDLANCVPLEGGGPGRNFRINGDGAFEKLPAGGPAGYAAAFFLCALPAQAQDPGGNAGDLCAVGYFIGWDSSQTARQPALHLYRYFRSGDVTFAAHSGGSLFADVGQAPHGEEILAHNVRSFRMTPLVITNGAYSTNFTAHPERPHPDVIEISLTLLPRDTARRLVRKEDWTSSHGRLAGQQTFTLRVPLNPAVP